MNVRYLLLLVAAAATAAASMASAASPGQRMGDVEVSIEPVPSSRSRGVLGEGYFEVSVRLVNHSNQNDHQIRLTAGGESGRSGETVVREVTLPKGTALNVSLYDGGWMADSLRVRVDSNDFPEPFPLDLPRRYSSYDYYSSSNSRQILVSHNVPEEISPPEEESYGRPHFSIFRHELPAAAWSDNWLGYTCYDTVLLTEKEAHELSKGAQLALRRYAESGGTVLIQGNNAPELMVADATPVDPKSFPVGFGIIRLTGLGDSDEGWMSLRATGFDEGRSEQRPGSSLIANPKVPVKGIFLFVLVFAVVVGPLNVFILGRKDRRMMLWWNVPAAALATCAGILLYSIFSEGWSGREKIVAFTVLDENTHRASTAGYASFYSPLTPSQGVWFSEETQVQPIVGESEDYYSYYSHRSRPTAGRMIDQTSGQRFRSGWVTARSCANFTIIKNETRRERLSLQQDGDALVAGNNLGVPIEELYVRDAKGAVFRGQNIAPGTEARLAKRTDNLPTKRLRELFVQRGPGIAAVSTTELLDYLQPGCYLAVCGRSPFVENSLDGAKDEKSRSIIYGISRRTPDGR